MIPGRKYHTRISWKGNHYRKWSPDGINIPENHVNELTRGGLGDDEIVNDGSVTSQRRDGLKRSTIEHVNPTVAAVEGNGFVLRLG